MVDEGPISARTWARAADPISKAGYMDGAADGQKETFQLSFDKGYELGFIFGAEIGKLDAKLSSLDQEKPNKLRLSDPLGINCQICITTSMAQESIDDLYNMQKQKNSDYLKNLDKALE